MDERFSSVVAEMERQVASGLRPGLRVAVSWRGERVLDAGVGGDTGAPYVLWSTTKPFVAVPLLLAIAAGRAALDDRVSRFLPEFGKNGKERATLAHVLSHRGGFPDNSPEVRRGLQPSLRDWDAALAFVCDMPAAWEPGTDRGYHPATGWFVVGELVQRLFDRPLADVIDEHVLAPCGIEPAEFALGRPQRLARPPHAVETNGERGAPPEAEARFWNDPETHAAVIPGAGGLASAGAVLRFYETLLADRRGPGGRLLSHEMARCATFPHAVGIVDRTFLRNIPWGLGFHLKHVVPSLDDCGASATPGTFGHGGHFLVNTAWADPTKELACCVLSNGLSPARDGVRGVGRISQAVHDVVDGVAA